MKIAKRAPFYGKPVIHTPQIFGASAGKNFIYRIPTTGTRPINIKLGNIPDGISIENGIIFGNLSDCKEYQIEIIAENCEGITKKTLKIIIEEDGPLKTPLLGFTTWNAFGSKVSQKDVISSATALIESGIADYGYGYVNIDSGWQKEYGGKYDAIMPNEKFPDMKELCDQVHSLGLRCGIYSTPMLTAWGCPEELESIPGCTRGEPDPCFYGISNGGVGLDRRERANVKQWTEWGFDYLKYDWHPADAANANAMKNVLMASEREFAYCVTVSAPIQNGQYLKENVNSYRLNPDSLPTWQNLRHRLDTVRGWDSYVCLGHFYDLDMLAAGGYDRGSFIGALTDDEEIFAYTLVSFFMSPIQISTPIDKLSDFLLDVFCNEEIIEINQDIKAEYPTLVRKNLNVRIYKRNLYNGDIAYAVFNLADEKRTEVFEVGETKSIRDVWRKENIENTDVISCELEPHGAMVYRITPKI